MSREPGQIRFEETQRFRQPLIWTLVLLGVGAMILAAVLNATAGGRAEAALFLALPVAVIVSLVLFIKLVVRVTDEELTIDFRPFVHRRISPREITAVEAGPYHPLREFGGWGVRFSFRGVRSYTVTGNRGVRVTLADGRRLLIGSQRPRELANAIEALRAATGRR